MITGIRRTVTSLADYVVVLWNYPVGTVSVSVKSGVPARLATATKAEAIDHLFQLIVQQQSPTDRSATIKSRDHIQTEHMLENLVKFLESHDEEHRMSYISVLLTARTWQQYKFKATVLNKNRKNYDKTRQHNTQLLPTHGATTHWSCNNTLFVTTLMKLLHTTDPKKLRFSTRTSAEYGSDSSGWFLIDVIVDLGRRQVGRVWR